MITYKELSDTFENMVSIKDMTKKELKEHMRINEEIMDESEYGSGDYNIAEAEYHVAEKELKRRNRSMER